MLKKVLVVLIRQHFVCVNRRLDRALMKKKLNVLSLSLSQENHSYFSILISQTHTLE